MVNVFFQFDKLIAGVRDGGYATEQSYCEILQTLIYEIIRLYIFIHFLAEKKKIKCINHKRGVAPE